MPTYTYECTRCDSTMEQIRKIDDRDRLTLCKRCRKPIDRKVDAPGLVWAPTAGGMR
jgi:putative FmdB family regulatory protein